jgi:hypothetical protein
MSRPRNIIAPPCRWSPLRNVSVTKILPRGRRKTTLDMTLIRQTNTNSHLSEPSMDQILQDRLKPFSWSPWQIDAIQILHGFVANLKAFHEQKRVSSTKSTFGVVVYRIDSASPSKPCEKKKGIVWYTPCAEGRRAVVVEPMMRETQPRALDLILLRLSALSLLAEQNETWPQHAGFGPFPLRFVSVPLGHCARRWNSQKAGPQNHRGDSG